MLKQRFEATGQINSSNDSQSSASSRQGKAITYHYKLITTQTREAILESNQNNEQQATRASLKKFLCGCFGDMK